MLGIVFLLVVACVAEGNYFYREITGPVPSDADTLANRKGVIYWHGDPHRKTVALTFDDGPSAPYTTKILSILKANDVKATFFFLGDRVEASPELARAVVEDGHAIGNHTYDHPSLVLESASSVRAQLRRAENAIIAATGVRPKFFRPPYGAADSFTLDEARRLGYVAIEWSNSSKDWLRPGANAIADRVLRQVKNGSIILLHDGGGDRSQTVAAVTKLIPELKRRGFEFVTVPEMLDIPATF
ncbi:MAG: polysaccharide deacetylase family protein [Proteobacteria bacterium]|nr:polysaccharide deacetylase family protein [Pseudomonadota bacterium]